MNHYRTGYLLIVDDEILTVSATMIKPEYERMGHRIINGIYFIIYRAG